VTRRLALLVPTLFLVSVMAFCVVRLIPGDVVDIMYAEHNYASTKTLMRHKLGLDQPLPVQYGEWVGDLVRGRFGASLFSKRTIGQELRYRFPVTLELGLIAFCLAMLVAVPLGVLSAVKQDTIFDYAARIYALGGLSIPSFWLATLVLIYGAKWFHWSPPAVYVSLPTDPIANLEHLIIPALLLGAFGWGSVIRLTRTMLLEVLREDYVRTARAKGLSGRQVIMSHAMRNALIPVITVVGSFIPAVLGGSVIIETIFGLPGLGRFTIDVINNRDYPMLQAIVLIFGVMVLVSNLVVDLAYGILDPRIRHA
jgi:peptide/nickel transport system permease protein